MRRKKGKTIEIKKNKKEREGENKFHKQNASAKIKFIAIKNAKIIALKCSWIAPNCEAS